ncbi:hypothetical protein A6A08_06055 [Nocardiopsis sp. TSRI0078]|uniref:TetR/AcrR family transcriptional regulator n=1 Tax=unclassified Nocardiopsis TaxID=2649073 RepID=UPI00093A9030|nr:TetR family transcriptional regulator C-terminal domain-containing protein [Nocardiopsis sp. TSRI0078]OKI16841.1 hypothetical protein A6A08_06055 [Nocardiopsis sp. TSRI0078]
MPKRVDRAARRDEIVRTYLKIASRDGVEAATTRALAAELGVAVGSLWYYFSGFDEVLSRAFQLIFERTDERISRGVGKHQGLAAITRMLHEVLPVKKDTEDEAYVVVSFWGRVPANPSLGRLQVRVAEQWRARIADHLYEAVTRHELVPQAPVAQITDMLMILTTGAQVEYVLHTPIARRERQWRAVHHCLSGWLTDQGARASGLLEPTRIPAAPEA